MAPTDLGRFDSMVMPLELEAFDALKSRSGRGAEGPWPGKGSGQGWVQLGVRWGNWWLSWLQCARLPSAQPTTTSPPRDTSSQQCLVSATLQICLVAGLPCGEWCGVERVGGNFEGGNRELV